FLPLGVDEDLEGRVGDRAARARLRRDVVGVPDALELSARADSPAEGRLEAMRDDVPTDRGGRVARRIDADGDHVQLRLAAGRSRDRLVELSRDQRADIRAARVPERDEEPAAALRRGAHRLAVLTLEPEVRRSDRRVDRRAGELRRLRPAAAAGEHEQPEHEGAPHRLRTTTRTTSAIATRTSTAATITSRSRHALCPFFSDAASSVMPRRATSATTARSAAAISGPASAVLGGGSFAITARSPGGTGRPWL